MNTRSIHFRLILWYAALILLVSLTFSAYIYKGVDHRLYDEMAQRLSRRTKLISENIIPLIGEKSQSAIAIDMRNIYSPEINNRFIRILRPDRSIYYVSGIPKDEQFEPARISPLPEQIPLRREEVINPKLSMLIVTMPVEQKGKTYYIEAGSLTDGTATALHSLVITMLLGLPILILVAAAGVFVVVRYSLKPVERMRATAEQITFGNLKNRLPVLYTGDELEHLSVTLNQMLERLDRAYEQSTRFSADASHELRTPLSFMLGELETMVEDSKLPESFRARIGSLYEEAERLSKITEDLFALSRLDAGEAKIEHLRFDLAALVQSTVEQMAVLAEEKHITLDVKTTQNVPVFGDRARLKQVVINLLDNAIKYTPGGGLITLKVFSADHKAILEITDNGVGIPAVSLPYIFERLYRADKARSRDQGGAGLGLSIVRSICQAHGGNVDIQSVEGKYTTCRVELFLAVGQQQENAA